MHVLKRDGRRENVYFDKITARIKALCYDLDMAYVDPPAIALRVINDLYSGVTTIQLDNTAAEIAASMIHQHPDYGTLAVRIAVSNLHKETKGSFSEMIFDLYSVKSLVTNEHMPVISKRYYDIVKEHANRLDSSLLYDRDFLYNYNTIRMLENNYLLKLKGKIVERPQDMFMRVAIAIHDDDIDKVIKTYNLLSKQYFVHSSQTMRSACTVKQQMASSVLLTMSEDSIDGILESLERCALLCHCNADIGFNVHCIRAKNTPIKGTGGVSNGLVPMLRTYNTCNPTVSTSDKSEGPITVYLEPWHADIFEFLELKRNIGEEQLRAKDMFYALWTPNLFMKRVYSDDVWSLMCPHECPGLIDAWGDDFETLYIQYEEEGRYRRRVQARELWVLITQLQVETGTPYIVYKDHCNQKTNHQNLGTIRCGSFSTELMQYSSPDEVAMCNTASIALNMFVNSSLNVFDFYKLKEVTKVLTCNLDKLIDVNVYPMPESKSSSYKHRCIGIGVQGLADVFILLKYPYESEEAKQLNIQIFETLYYGALESSCDIAAEKGPYETYEGSPISKGILQYDMWNIKPTDLWDWDALKVKIAKHGVRNSLLITQMSDSFMAQILETSESVEPYACNIYKMHVLSKDINIIKPRLLKDLMTLDCWNEDTCEKIIEDGGSIQNINGISQDMKSLYKTTWEMPQKVIFEMAAARGPFIDQSQCLNVHMIDPLEKLTSMHFYNWEMGLKSSMCRLKTEKSIDSKIFSNTDT